MRLVFALTCQKHFPFYYSTIAQLLFTDYCVRCFDSKPGLSNHIDIHKLYRKTFNCDFPDCEKVLSSSPTLRYNKAAVHEKVHRFECNKCGKKFHFKQTLLDHMDHHELLCSLPLPTDFVLQKLSNWSWTQSSLEIFALQRRTFSCEICLSTFTKAKQPEYKLWYALKK